MKTLGEVAHHIQLLPAPVPFVAVSVEHWENIREEYREWCEDQGEEFKASPTLHANNFLVFGIPVIAAGHA